MYKLKSYIGIPSLLLFSKLLFAQNPIITNQFSADPSARVFGDRVFVYPSHDIPTPPEKPGRKDWFCMEDYHVFSSANLTEWTDLGVIVSQNKVKWVDSTKYSMWAPDCIFRNGKYYFYFPAIANDTSSVKGFSIGVAISENPYGPFVPQSDPIKNVHGIDPNVFIDNDGQAYLYWSARNIYVAKLKDNMLELDSEPLIIANLPEKGLKEGPFLFERNGIYYLTFPHVENKTERLEYAIGKSPMGPFKSAGVIMDESPSGCWTNHHSIIKFKNQLYLFYHNNDLSPKFDKNRSVRIDSLFFNDDGTMRKIKPTLRGVGITNATEQINLDRYSEISKTGASVFFLDSLNTFKGWKVSLIEGNAWVQYNMVDFGNDIISTVSAKLISHTGGNLQLRLDNTGGLLLAEINLPESNDWILVDSKLNFLPKEIHNIVLIKKDGGPVEIDWIRFNK